MGLCSEIKVSTIYYYVENSFKSDRGICNIFNLTDSFEKGCQFLRCRVAFLDEIELMADSRGLIFKDGLICINEGYYLWDATNKMYFLVDVNSGIGEIM